MRDVRTRSNIMRIDGTLKSWNDERGFGFIDPTQGGQEIFVHIKAFEVRTERPQVSQRLTFEVEVNPDGKKRAKLVQQVRLTRASSRRRDSPAQWGTASYFAIPAFLVLYFFVAIVWRVPNWVAGLYLAASQVGRSCRSVAGIGKHAHLLRPCRRLARSHRRSTGLSPQVQQGGVSLGILGQRGTERSRLHCAQFALTFAPSCMMTSSNFRCSGRLSAPLTKTLERT